MLALIYPFVPEHEQYYLDVQFEGEDAQPIEIFRCRDRIDL
jgi:hypothetical protein